MKKITFENPLQKRSSKARCAHQAMMEMVIIAGFAPKQFQPMWARLIKQSGINDLDLQRLIVVARKLNGYCPRGFVRNRLRDKDWLRYFD